MLFDADVACRDDCSDVLELCAVVDAALVIDKASDIYGIYVSPPDEGEPGREPVLLITVFDVMTLCTLTEEGLSTGGVTATYITFELLAEVFGFDVLLLQSACTGVLHRGDTITLSTFGVILSPPCTRGDR